MPKTLVNAFKQAIAENKLSREDLKGKGDGTENFAKEALELLYIKSQVQNTYGARQRPAPRIDF